MCCTPLFRFMSDRFMSEHRKIWLTPVDPFFTVEIDFSEDIEHIREQIEERRRGPKKEEGVSPNKEADSPSEEADTDVKE